MSRDDAFHLLQNGRRRAVLRHLLEHDDVEVFPVTDVVESIAAWDQDTTAEQLDPNHRKRIYVSLYQSHLPKLHEHGVIDYDREGMTISLRPLAYALSPFLREGLHAPQTISVDGPGPTETETSPVEQVLSRLGLASR